MNFLKQNKNLIIIVIVVLVTDLLSFKIPKEEVQNVISNSGILAPVIYIFFHLLTYIFAPLSGTPVGAVGFYLFGKKVVFYSFITVMISSVINFYIARVWGIKMVNKLVGENSIKKYHNFVKTYGYLTLILARLFLHGFNDITSYLAGVSKMKFKPYIIISFFATIPGTLIMYFISVRSTSVSEYVIFTLLYGTLFIPIFIVSKKILRK